MRMTPSHPHLACLTTAQLDMSCALVGFHKIEMIRAQNPESVVVREQSIAYCRQD